MRFFFLSFFFSAALQGWAQTPAANTCSPPSLQPGTAFPLLRWSWVSSVPGGAGDHPATLPNPPQAHWDRIFPSNSSRSSHGSAEAAPRCWSLREAKWKSLAGEVSCQSLLFHLTFPSCPGDLLFPDFLLPVFPSVFPAFPFSPRGSPRSGARPACFNEGFNSGPAGWAG